MYEVIVLKDGYSIKEGPGQQKACGSITLLKGPQNIIVDTGNPWDKDLILEGLHSLGIHEHQVNYVVCTSGKTNKIGNLNIFNNAVYIIASEISKGDKYLTHSFQEYIDGLHLIVLDNHPENIMKIEDIVYNVQGLKQYNLSPEKIQFVVGTHGHSDHIGNLNLFTNAIHIVSHDICVGDQYMLHDFAQGIPYEIDDNIEVISTPGHTGSDVSVIARNTQLGNVAITGDLFECYEDLEDYTLWQDNSENPEVQLQNRMDVLQMVDWIVPGHGPKFKVPEDYKMQMKMVMYYESKTVETSSGIETSESSCVVIEED